LYFIQIQFVLDIVIDSNGSYIVLEKVWRYQKGNQNPYIEEEQTTQWPKERVQKDKQRSTKHTYKTKDRVTRCLIQTIGISLEKQNRNENAIKQVDCIKTRE
jgi:hypothetical protein